eukprot:350136-Chlamydomonas_euryale.AAC.4
MHTLLCLAWPHAAGAGAADAAAPVPPAARCIHGQGVCVHSCAPRRGLHAACVVGCAGLWASDGPYPTEFKGMCGLCGGLCESVWLGSVGSAHWQACVGSVALASCEGAASGASITTGLMSPVWPYCSALHYQPCVDSCTGTAVRPALAHPLPPSPPQPNTGALKTDGTCPSLVLSLFARLTLVFLLRCVLSKLRCLVSRVADAVYLPSGWPYCCWLAEISAIVACRCQVETGTLRRKVTWFVRLADMPVQRAETQSVPACAS